MTIRWRDQRPRAAQAEAKTELLDSLERLAHEVDRVRADQGFNALLRGIAKIWRYSILNHLMILFQYPEATSVHGMRQWEKLGRTIKPDAKAIVITAPSGTAGKYVWVEVFDVTQTDGPPIPKHGMRKGECSHLEAIEQAAENLGVEVRELDPESSSSHSAHAGIPGPNTADFSFGVSVFRWPRRELFSCTVGCLLSGEETLFSLSQFAAAVIRTTWDYHERYSEFCEWLVNVGTQVVQRACRSLHRIHSQTNRVSHLFSSDASCS